MTANEHCDAALARARQRLARSRQALIEQMRIGGAGNAQADRSPGDDGQGGPWSWLQQAWQNHPAWLAVQALAPLLREHTRRHPWQVLALSGLLGGAVMLLRPWRLLPLGAVLMTAARTVPLAQLLSAWLHRAQQGQAGSEQAHERRHERGHERRYEQTHDQGGDQGSRRSD